MSDTSENGLSGQALGFMRQAIELSEENVRSGGGPFGAVIVRDGRVIATGTNGVTRLNDPTAHAEVTAIRNAARALGTFDLSGCEIYTSCEPCPMCLGAIYWARIGKMYYGNDQEDARRIGFDDSFIYEEIALPPAQRRLRSCRILSEEARKAFGMKSPINGNIDPVGKIVLRFRNLFLPLSRIRCHGWNMTRRESCENQEQYPLL